MRFINTSLILLIVQVNLYTQISFENPSFENKESGYNIVPNSWFVCEGTPDLAPIAPNFDLTPTDGLNYVQILAGIGSDGITIEESIGQSLSNYLEIDSCYSLTYDVGNITGINNDQIRGSIKIYIADSLCKTQQRIDYFEIEEFELLPRTIEFIPKFPWSKFIVFQSSIRTDSETSWIGLDNLREIEKCEISTTSNSITNKCNVYYNDILNVIELTGNCILNEKIEIYDVLGRRVLILYANEKQIPISLKTGMYYLVMGQNTEVFYLK